MLQVSRVEDYISNFYIEEFDCLRPNTYSEYETRSVVNWAILKAE